MLLVGLTADEQDVVLDVGQMVLDILGMVEPTPCADVSSAVTSLARGQWEAAASSCSYRAHGRRWRSSAHPERARAPSTGATAAERRREREGELRALAPDRSDVVLLRKAGESKLVVEVGAGMVLTGLQLQAGGSVEL